MTNSIKVFGIGEDVSLFLELKNTPTLFVKIYEINLENYYRSTLSPFKTDINLDGLLPSEEKKYNYNEASQISFTKKIDFPSLKNKTGLFVIDLLGNGKSSRAVIKKGILSLIHNPTIAGHIAYILDGNKQVCMNNDTGIWIDNKYYPADLNKSGRIVIPFSQSQHLSKAVLVHGSVAQLVEFKRQSEEYTFKAGIFVLPESLITGKKASVLIRPNLLINGIKAPFNLLKNTKVTISTVNTIEQSTNTQTFENILISDDRDIEINFQVPPNLGELKIELSTEVYNASKEKEQSFVITKNFEMETFQNDNQSFELFLQNQQGNYELFILGKNGEPYVSF
jgi:hypothetical protein